MTVAGMYTRCGGRPDIMETSSVNASGWQSQQLRSHSTSAVTCRAMHVQGLHHMSRNLRLLTSSVV